MLAFTDAAHPDANIIFGAVIDDALGDEVRVTVIAAGFDGGMPKRREAAPQVRREAPAQSQAETRAAASSLRQQPERVPSRPLAPAGHGSGLSGTVNYTVRPSAEPERAAVGAPVRTAPTTTIDEDLDIPDFLK